MRTVTKELVEAIVPVGASTHRDSDTPPAFKVGDRVRAKNVNPVTHTRLPRYARGKIGEIVIQHGVFTLADSMAHLKGEQPQHLYNVMFTSQELWGEDSTTKDKVYMDLWECYLEGVSG
ncbi:SH3-like domain-containing protein [Agrobacterium sp. NPDC090283]|uniref:SH3-like domain-containing protein n=1 Tax=Agrobacterium sp. NPDC090283 TaxID=3363920 RepID=UPI00383AFD63